MAQNLKFGRLEEEIRELEEEGVPLSFIVNNFLDKDGGEVRGKIDMTNQPIKNLPEPVDGQDAATKNYVDTVGGHSFFRRKPDNGYLATESLDMNENRITNLRMPIEDREASTKLYTDIATDDLKNRLENNNPFFFNTDKHKARSGIDMQNFKLEGLPMPVNDKDASNKIYVDSLTEDRRRKLEVNNPFTFDNGEYGAKNKLNMKNFKISGLGFPDLPEDAASVAYVDEAVPWVKKNGGYEAKDHIYLGKKKLGGLRDPVNSGEATNKKYLDSEIKKVKDETIKKDASGFYSADTNINLNNFRLFGVPDPQREDETANKKYVDEKTANIQPGGVDAAGIDKIKTDLEKNQAFNTRNQKTYNAKGNINMKGKTIRNFAEPTDDDDAINKGYIDTIDERIKTDIETLKTTDEENFKKLDDEREKQAMHLATSFIGITKDQTFKTIIEEFEELFNRRGALLFNSLEIVKNNFDLFLNAAKRKRAEKFKEDFNLNPPKEIEQFDYFFRKFLNQLTELYNGLDEATKRDNDAVKEIITKEIYKFKIDENILDPSFIKLNGHFLAAGEVDMNQKKIINLPPPTEETEAVNRGYVDEMRELFEKKIKKIEKAAASANRGGGNAGAAVSGDMKGKKIINLADPEDDGDGANKLYVDQSINNIDRGLIRRNGGFLAIDSIDMNSNRIKNVGYPQVYDDVVNKIYVDSKTDNIPFKRLNGNFLAVSEFDMGIKKIKNLALPVDDTDATNKQYVDDEIKSIITPFNKEKNEIKAVSSFDMNIKRIKNLPEPLDRADAVPRFYVDSIIKLIPEPIEDYNAANKLYVDKEVIKKTLPEDILLKILGTSITLIRGEAKGPIIGMDKTNVPGLGFLERIGFNKKFGYFSDARGKKVDFSEIYFGNFDSGIYYSDFDDDLINKDIKIKRYPLFTFPCSASIFNYAVAVKFKGDEKIKDEVIKLKIFTFNLDGEGLDPVTFNVRHPNLPGRSEEITIKVSGKNTAFKCGKINPGYGFKGGECDHIALLFETSHEKIERFNITLSALLHYDDFKKEYFPTVYPF